MGFLARQTKQRITHLRRLFFPSNQLSQALAQAHARPIQHHKAVGRCDPEFLTDFVGLLFEPLPHHENPAEARRQLVDTGLQDLQELRLAQRRLGLRPRLHRIREVAVGVEQLVVGLGLRRLDRGLDRDLAMTARGTGR